MADNGEASYAAYTCPLSSKGYILPYIPYPGARLLVGTDEQTDPLMDTQTVPWTAPC